MRFEVTVLLSGDQYTYSLALELPDKFKELRVLQESLEVSGANLCMPEITPRSRYPSTCHIGMPRSFWLTGI